ncbi:MAG: hypothetical protein ACP5E2_15230, partial [Terracidiphilus sp.]
MAQKSLCGKREREKQGFFRSLSSRALSKRGQAIISVHAIALAHARRLDATLLKAAAGSAIPSRP